MSAEHLRVVVVDHRLDLSLQAVVFMSQRSFRVDVVVGRMVQFSLQLGDQLKRNKCISLGCKCNCIFTNVEAIIVFFGVSEVLKKPRKFFRPGFESLKNIGLDLTRNY